MTDRASVLERAQWGLEATPGTAVPATTAVRSMSIDIDVGGEAEIFRPTGHKFGSLAIPNAEWTTWKADGRPTYTEVVYLLESLCGTVTATAVGSTGWKRVYTISDTAADAAKTLTIEKGSAVRAHKVAYGLATDHAFSFSRKNGLKMTAAGIGQLLSDGITMTPGLTSLPLVPLVGKQCDLYIDSSGASLGSTKMLRGFQVDPSITGKYGPVWPINSASPSYNGHVELAPTSGKLLTLEADAAGMAYLSQFRAGTVIFCRIKAEGPLFEAGTPGVNYEFIYDSCLGIRKIQNLGKDFEGVAVVEIDTELVEDDTWGHAVQISVTNAVAAGAL